MTGRIWKTGNGVKYECKGHTQLYVRTKFSDRPRGESADKSGGQKQTSTVPAPPAQVSPSLSGRIEGLLSRVSEIGSKRKGAK